MSIPTVPAAETAVMLAADTLRACFEEALGRPVCIRAGASITLWASTTEDECCSGAAWIRIGPMYPGFPEQDPTPQPCWPPLWSLVLEMGAARCAPTPDAQSIPTCDQHTALAGDIVADAAAMLCAAACFTSATEDQVQIGAWEPAPIEANCAGGSLTLTVSFSPCLTCP
jgi:hypothetical protein